MTSTNLKTSDISIIIPTLNEENNIRRLAITLLGQVGEIIVADGGSSDNTVANAREKGLRAISCPPGRAVQLNHGADLACGKILLFLHADTQLPAGFADLVVHTLQNPKNVAGAFSLAIDQPTPTLRFIAFCTNLRSKYFQLPYGDQAIFITRENYTELGKFPHMVIMEDYAFIKKAQQRGTIVTLEETVVTSGRRWRRLGTLRTTLINQLVIVGYHLKIPLKYLASLYRL